MDKPLIHKGLSIFYGRNNADQAPICMTIKGVFYMEQNEIKEQIILSPELQESILKFFLRTSIPRKAKEERMKKALLETERQEQN